MTIDTPALPANANVLVSEVMNKVIVDESECAFGRIPDPRLERIFRDIRTYHIDMPELAELANDAGVATLVMTHLVPASGIISRCATGQLLNLSFTIFPGSTISLAVDLQSILTRHLHAGLFHLKRPTFPFECSFYFQLPGFSYSCMPW